MSARPGTTAAFYAPMKPPGHPVPSGDREMARALTAMLRALGWQVNLASELRVHDKTGDAARQAELIRQAGCEAERLASAMPPADIWITYHNYYKAPDLIGPAVARARGIPYVQIESTRALKRLGGPWDRFARAAHEAADAAALIFHLTEHDRAALVRDRPSAQVLAPLSPFLPRTDLPAPSDLEGPMLTAAMMRPGDKLASYQIIADALAQLSGEWQLEIAGDGPSRPEVEAMMAPFGARVRFLGALDRLELERAFQRAGLFLWPGAGEAFGMVYLEAQAHGLPAAAQDRPGVRDVLAPGRYPAPAAGPGALAAAVAELLNDKDLRARRGAAAREMIAGHHLLPAAARQFIRAAAPLLEDA